MRLLLLKLRRDMSTGLHSYGHRGPTPRAVAHVAFGTAGGTTARPQAKPHVGGHVAETCEADSDAPPSSLPRDLGGRSAALLVNIANALLAEIGITLKDRDLVVPPFSLSDLLGFKIRVFEPLGNARP